jgi:acyl carrier protein
MNKQEFLEEIADIIECETSEISFDTVLEDVGEWDSLAVIGFVAMLDEKCDKIIDGELLTEVKTVHDLYSLAIA